MIGIPAQEFKWTDSDSFAKPVVSVGSPPESTISFHSGSSEILKITEDGFYIRGKRVPVDSKEAESVYKAFKEFLVYHALSKP